MNIFAEFIHSIYDFKSYKGFQENSWLKTLLYGVLLGTIVIFITLFLPLLMLLIPSGGMEGLAREYIPEFVLEDDEFWIEEPVEYTQYNPGQRITVKDDNTDSEKPSDRECPDGNCGRRGPHSERNRARRIPIGENFTFIIEINPDCRHGKCRPQDKPENGETAPAPDDSENGTTTD